LDAHIFNNIVGKLPFQTYQLHYRQFLTELLLKEEGGRFGDIM